MDHIQQLCKLPVKVVGARVRAYRWVLVRSCLLSITERTGVACVFV